MEEDVIKTNARNSGDLEEGVPRGWGVKLRLTCGYISKVGLKASANELDVGCKRKKTRGCPLGF